MSQVVKIFKFLDRNLCLWFCHDAFEFDALVIFKKCLICSSFLGHIESKKLIKQF